MTVMSEYGLTQMDWSSVAWGETKQKVDTDLQYL